MLRLSHCCHLPEYSTCHSMFTDMSRNMSKPTKWHVRPAKTHVSLGICPVWSESLLSAWRKLGSLATHWVHSEDFDQTGRMSRLIWVFAGRTVILLVLSWSSSIMFLDHTIKSWQKIPGQRVLVSNVLEWLNYFFMYLQFLWGQWSRPEKATVNMTWLVLTVKNVWQAQLKHWLVTEPEQRKPFKIACALGAYSDQPGHLCSLISLCLAFHR